MTSAPMIISNVSNTAVRWAWKAQSHFNLAHACENTYITSVVLSDCICYPTFVPDAIFIVKCHIIVEKESKKLIRRNQLIKDVVVDDIQRKSSVHQHIFSLKKEDISVDFLWINLDQLSYAQQLTHMMFGYYSIQAAMVLFLVQPQRTIIPKVNALLLPSAPVQHHYHHLRLSWFTLSAVESRELRRNWKLIDISIARLTIVYHFGQNTTS